MLITRSWFLLLILSLISTDPYSFVVAFVSPAVRIVHNVRDETTISVNHALCYTRTTTSLHAKCEHEPNKTRWRNPRRIVKPLRHIPLTLFTLSTALLPFRTPPASAVSTTKVSHMKTKVDSNQRSKSFDSKMQQEIEHLMKCNEIESLEGFEAREAFEKIYEEKNIQRAMERKKLLYRLIQEGICPFVDVEGERQMYLFDTSQDLNHIPFSDQQKELSLMKDRKWRERRRKQRYVIKCIAEDIRLQGKDPISYLERNQDQTRKILGLSDRSLDVIVKRYKHLFKTQGNLSGSSTDEPFDVNEAIKLPFSKEQETVNQNIRKAALKEVSLAEKNSKRGANAKRPVMKDESLHSGEGSKRKLPKYQMVGAVGAIGFGIYRMEMERTKKEISKMKNSLDIDESSKTIEPDDPFIEQVEEYSPDDSQDDDIYQINGDSVGADYQQQELYTLYQKWVKENENNTNITAYKEGDSKDGEAYALYQQWVQEHQASNESIGGELKSENAAENERLKDTMLSQTNEVENDSQSMKTQNESYTLYQQWVLENQNSTSSFYKEGDSKNGEAYALYQQWVQDQKNPDEIIEDHTNITIHEKTDDTSHQNDLMPPLCIETLENLEESRVNLEGGQIITNFTNSSPDTYTGKEVEKVPVQIPIIEAHRIDIEKNSILEQEKISDFRSLFRTIQNMIMGESIFGRKEFAGASILSIAAITVGMQLMRREKEVVPETTIQSTFQHDTSDNDTTTLITIQDKVDLMNHLEEELNEIEHEMNSIKESHARVSIKHFDENAKNESIITS